jgi:hypothetical protein
MQFVARTAFVALIVSSLAAAAAAQTATPKAQTAAPPRAQAAPPPKADPRDQNLRAYAELLRSDVRSQKVAIFTQMMDFTEAEDAAFWPVYRQYDVELSALNDQRVRLIADYAKNFESMTDESADRIARGALDFEAKRAALKAKYFDKVKAALSAKQAARFLQIENQLLMIIDLQISASLPIVD